MKGKSIVIPSILHDQFKLQLDQFLSGLSCDTLKIEIDRPLAQRIQRSGKVDHDGKQTYFGQFMQQLLSDPGPCKSFLKWLAQTKKEACLFSYKEEDKIDSLDYYA